ncbi:MAG: two-component system, OmpR family, sensor kinase [Candidatus Eremiobacteraeota bacterium]|jgi:two-component system OmpR family sensor kinase|nr:two-component system, OmpR family, sensor kinase [Candidatus Eremiobacteraeota bacterium]
MDERRPRSFAMRLVFAYVGAAVGLMLLIGIASTVFTFSLYAQTANGAIQGTSSTIERRIAENAARRVPLRDLALRITRDLGRPHIHITVYDENGRVVSQTGPALENEGVVGAIASLMGLQRTRIPVTGTGGLIVISADLYQLQRTLHAYWLWMLPVGVLAVILAWAAGFAITRQAVLPLKQISAAMRRFAAGDFRPEPVRSTGDDELGELAHAYNGALHQVQSALAQRDRSEAEIRQFIADAGHELRTPLTVIMGYLDVLEDGMVEAPQVRQRVIATMRQESRRMRGLIEKLIYLARLERGEPVAQQIVEVAKVVERVVGSAAPEFPATIAVTSAPDARVVADETDIFEAIRNLVDNALKYAPASEVAVSTAVQGDDVVVVVRDRGPGMSEHDRAHAFDRFYRGRGVDGVDGSGIGLAIVKRATERAGGTVSVDSRQGDGAAFTIRLPRAVA